MFDPELFLSLNHYDDERPTASFFAGASVLNTAETVGSAGLQDGAADRDEPRGVPQYGQVGERIPPLLFSIRSTTPSGV